MQIREQGRKVQCIRSEYDAVIGRSRQKVVATFPRYTQTMPATGLDELTDKERQTLEDWLAEKREQSQAANRGYVARSAATWLGDLSAAITAGDAAMTPERAVAIWKGLADVAKALRKAGNPKPKAAPKPKADAAQPPAKTDATPAVAPKPAKQAATATKKPAATKTPPKGVAASLAPSEAQQVAKVGSSKPAKPALAPKGKGGEGAGK